MKNAVCNVRRPLAAHKRAMVEVRMGLLPFVLLGGLSPTRGQDPNLLARRSTRREIPTRLVSRGGKSCGRGRPGDRARAASRRSKQQGHIKTRTRRRPDPMRARPAHRGIHQGRHLRCRPRQVRARGREDRYHHALRRPDARRLLLRQQLPAHAQQHRRPTCSSSLPSKASTSAASSTSAPTRCTARARRTRRGRSRTTSSSEPTNPYAATEAGAEVHGQGLPPALQAVHHHLSRQQRIRPAPVPEKRRRRRRRRARTRLFALRARAQSR